MDDPVRTVRGDRGNWGTLLLAGGTAHAQSTTGRLRRNGLNRREGPWRSETGRRRAVRSHVKVNLRQQELEFGLVLNGRWAQQPA